MNFNFKEEPINNPGSSYLNKAGNHVATFVGAEYTKADNYECTDLTFDVDGAIFRERMFGTTLEKVYPMNVYENGTPREETKEEAYRRTYKEIYMNMFMVGVCFVDKDELIESIGEFSSLEDLTNKFNKAIKDSYDESLKLNILVGWRNSDSKQTSNLTVPQGAKWVEVAKFDNEGNLETPTTKWRSTRQSTIMMEEKYPYGGGSNNESTGTDSPIIGGSATNSSEVDDDLPF